MMFLFSSIKTKIILFSNENFKIGQKQKGGLLFEASVRKPSGNYLSRKGIDWVTAEKSRV